MMHTNIYTYIKYGKVPRRVTFIYIYMFDYIHKLYMNNFNSHVQYFVLGDDHMVLPTLKGII